MDEPHLPEINKKDPAHRNGRVYGSLTLFPRSCFSPEGALVLHLSFFAIDLSDSYLSIHMGMLYTVITAGE